jgi:hypothetical protein
MSIKAHIAHPVTPVALDDAFTVHPRREASPRVRRRDLQSNSATTINGPCIVIPVPDVVGDIVGACGVKGQSAKLLWTLGTLLLIAL